MKLKLCAWKCGRKTDRHCGVCLECCKKRDADIANGAPYRPYRLDKSTGAKQARTDVQRAALTRARMAKSLKQLAS